MSSDPRRPPSADRGYGGSAAFWDERAQRYDGHFDEPGPDGHALRSRLSVTLAALGNGPGNVLDAGMGPGRLCAILGDRGWTVWGVDASEEMVALARSRLPNASDRLVSASIEVMPFEDDWFDAVVATGVLEYAVVPDALRELARVVRPGGRIVVSYPNPRAAYRRWKMWVYYPVVRALKRLLRVPAAKLPRGAGSIPPERFRDLLRDLGLVVRAERYTSFIPALSPLEQVFPRSVDAFAARLEGRGGALGRSLATQVVFVAEKPAAPEFPDRLG